MIDVDCHLSVYNWADRNRKNQDDEMVSVSMEITFIYLIVIILLCVISHKTR